MRGHIGERSPGQWAIVLDVGDPETGKRRRKWHSFRGTHTFEVLSRTKAPASSSSSPVRERPPLAALIEVVHKRTKLGRYSRTENQTHRR